MRQRRWLKRSPMISFLIISCFRMSLQGAAMHTEGGGKWDQRFVAAQVVEQVTHDLNFGHQLLQCAPTSNEQLPTPSI